MKTKVYTVIKKMETEGWDLIALDSQTTKRGNVEWCVILRRDGIHIYMEFEKENNMWMRDVALECPKCGMAFNEDEHEEFCPDCEVSWDWKREIPADYK